MEAKQNKEEVNEGWIRLYRKSTESRVFQSEGLWKVWTWCLMKACHADQWVPMKTGKGTEEVYVGRGQFVFGRKTASKALKMPETTIYYRMRKLSNMRNLDIQSNTHYSIVTILNYNTYQGDGQSYPTPIFDNHSTTIRQPTDTYKNVKNDNNGGEGSKDPPSSVNQTPCIPLVKTNAIPKVQTEPLTDPAKIMKQRQYACLEYASRKCDLFDGCTHKTYGDCYLKCEQYNFWPDLSKRMELEDLIKREGYCCGPEGDLNDRHYPAGGVVSYLVHYVCMRCDKSDRWTVGQMEKCDKVQLEKVKYEERETKAKELTETIMQRVKETGFKFGGHEVPTIMACQRCAEDLIDKHESPIGWEECEWLEDLIPF